MNQPIGVIGAGSFGTSVANLISYNADVLIYSRNKALVDHINAGQPHLGVSFSKRVKATNDIQQIGEKCQVIFPVVPSENFRSMMQSLAPFLRPYHILIHGTKGFDINAPKDIPDGPITRSHVHTMSEVIRQESVVVRIGALSGPNLAKEIMEGQPTATVIASKFEEVIEKAAFRLELTEPKGLPRGKLRWHRVDEEGLETVQKKDPNTTFLQRLTVNLIGLLPIEWAL